MSGIYKTMGSSLNSQSGGFMGKLRNMSWKTIGIIVVIIAFIVGVTMYFMSPRKILTKSREGMENQDDSGKQAELMLFYVDWCPHCKTAKPEWEEIKAKYDGKTINGHKVIFTEINCTEETPEIEDMMNKYKIEGYPTIKLLKDGQIVEFDAKPTKESLDKFLNTVL